MRERIESLQHEAETRETQPEEYERDGVTVIENQSINRLQLVFPGKPPANVRAILKANGFHFSRQEMAWQRLLNANARAAAGLVLDSIAKMHPLLSAR